MSWFLLESVLEWAFYPVFYPQETRKNLFLFPKHVGASNALETEIALLPRLQNALEVRIPRFDYLGTTANGLHFVGYRAFQGPTMKELWEHLDYAKQEHTLSTIARFLRQVHSFPTGTARECGAQVRSFDVETASIVTSVHNEMRSILNPEDLDYLTGLFVEYVDTKPCTMNDPVCLHGDLSSKHLFLDEKSGHVTGIIDFGDVCIGDPDFDLMYLYGNYGWHFVERLLFYLPQGNVALLRRKLRLLFIASTIDNVRVGQARADMSLVQKNLIRLTAQIAKAKAGDFY